MYINEHLRDMRFSVCCINSRIHLLPEHLACAAFEHSNKAVALYICYMRLLLDYVSNIKATCSLATELK